MGRRACARGTATGSGGGCVCVWGGSVCVCGGGCVCVWGAGGGGW